MTAETKIELEAILDELIEGMLEYRTETDAGYTEENVKECRRILENHLETIANAKDRESAMKCVEATVLKLNELNEKAGESLIETDQREEICKYIILAGASLGYNGPDEDVTEEWREW